MNNNLTKPDDLVPIGKIVKPHGIKGEMKFLVYNEDSRVLEESSLVWLEKDSSQKFDVKKIQMISYTGNRIKFFEIDSRDKAESFRNFTLNVSRSEFPDINKEEDYLVDYIGMDVFNMEMNLLGTVADVLSIPGNDQLLVIHEGKEFLVPIVEQIIKQFDFENNQIKINPIEGLIE